MRRPSCCCWAPPSCWPRSWPANCSRCRSRSAGRRCWSAAPNCRWCSACCCCRRGRWASPTSPPAPWSSCSAGTAGATSRSTCRSSPSRPARRRCVMLAITGRPGRPPTGLQYLAVALGVLAGALMSAVAVGLTYRLLGPAEPLRRVIGRSMLSAAAIVTFALVGYTVLAWPGRSGPRLRRAGRRAGSALPHLLPVPAPARRPDPDVQLRPAGDRRRLRRSRTGGACWSRSATSSTPRSRCCG